eukprot:GSChrysophyteH1.ASY1.ANO1.1763.1 assembled CDS
MASLYEQGVVLGVEDGVYRLRGARIREEFQCPITYELLRDPVIAADGNTYERKAIEKWLAKSQTSPLSGENLEHTILSPNRAMKKIIQDLIDEGGVGLYTVDSAVTSENGINGLNKPKIRSFAVCKEHVLELTCAGPPEAEEWYKQSFQLTPRGCMGGRNNHGRHVINKEGVATHAPPDSLIARDMVVFSMPDISRCHFEMGLLAPGTYGIRDLGSRGGTFLRVPYSPDMFEVPLNSQSKSKSMPASSESRSSRSIPAEDANKTSIVVDSLLPNSKDRLPGQRLWPFAMFFVGRHHFVVEQIDDRFDNESNVAYMNAGASIAGVSSSSRKKASKEAAQHLASEAGDLVKQIERLSGSVDAKNEDSARNEMSLLQHRLEEISLKLYAGGSGNGKAEAKPQITAESKTAFDKKHPFANRRCVITCVGPEESPSLGKSYVLGAGGAILGRVGFDDPLRQEEYVVKFQGDHKAPDSKDGLGEDSVLDGIFLDPLLIPLNDKAMSSMHARIVMDPRDGVFSLIDGSYGVTLRESRTMVYTPRKNSVNGVWLRLSASQKKSRWFELRAGMEFQAAILRFSIARGDDTIYEKELPADDL